MLKLMSVTLILSLSCKPATTKPKDDAAVVRRDAQTADGPTHVVGAFGLTVTTGKTTNCGTDGAGLEGMLLALNDGKGNCVKTTLHVKEVGDFPTQCDPKVSVAVPCLETKNTVIGDNLEPGGYHLVVDGIKGGLICWRGDASIGVVSGTPSEQTLTLLHQPNC